MLIDLQLHSTNSDGYLSPTELAKFCHERGVKAASLTDHNTVSGLEEFRRACKQYKIAVIAGMEIYVKLGSQHFNLLWYNFDTEHPYLHKLLRDSQLRRRANVRRALAKLVKKKYQLDVNGILDSHSHYLPINRIIDSFFPLNKKRIQRELGKKNILETEIIRAYFRNPQQARLHESYIDIKRVAKIKKQVGGQLILAHPCKFRWMTEDNIRKLLAFGLDGLEVLSPHHSWEGVSYLQALADRHKLITTGGTDFHRFEKDDWYKIKSACSYFSIHSKLLPGVEVVTG